jgi:putative peptidoglycan lipid II flippase
MTGDDPDDWGATSHYSGGAPAAQPRTFTEADPISAAVPVGGEPQPQWSATTYVGRRSRRPDRADEPESAVEAPATERPGGRPAQRPADKGLLANSRTMAIASLVSRITGFLRSSLLVAAIGIHGVGDAYNAANNFPNMVYELLLGGVLSSVLVPLLVHAQEHDEDDGVAYTQRLLSIAAAALGVMTLVAVACAPLLATVFVSDPSQRSLTSVFATLLLPEIFFYGLGAMFMAVLNVRHSYGPGAWAPVLNNVVMIGTLAAFFVMPGPASLNPATMTTPQVLVLGIGTTLGIAAQALVLLPALRRTGFRWRWRFRAEPHEVGRLKEVSVLAGWVLGYVVASQIGVVAITKVGLGHRAFTVFTNADLLVQMPYGILVVSLLTALMPRLSRAAARGETRAVVDDLGLGARLSAVTLLPITAGLIALGAPLCITLFAYGETSLRGGELIGTALAASAFGLFPFAVVMLQLRVFYAMRDARTPTLINCAMVGTKVLLVVLAGRFFSGSAHIAEALTVSTSASYVVGAVVGHRLLTRRVGLLGFRSVAITCLRIGAASLVGGGAAYVVVLGAR